jgi:hypothetical protein
MDSGIDIVIPIPPFNELDDLVPFLWLIAPADKDMSRRLHRRGYEA